MTAHIADINALRLYREAKKKFECLELPDGIEYKEDDDTHPREWELVLPILTRNQLVRMFAKFGLDASVMKTRGELLGNWSYLHALQIGVDSYSAAGKAQDTWMGSMPKYRAAVIALVEQRMDDLRELHAQFGTFKANAEAYIE